MTTKQVVSVIRKTPDENGVYHFIENVNPKRFDTNEWKIDPSISEELKEVSTNYWKYVDDSVVEMTNEEKAAVDLAITDVEAMENAENVFTRSFNGCRIYLIRKVGFARTWNLSYGASYIHWSSQIKLSNISHRLKGIERAGRFKLKKITMDGFFSTKSETKVILHAIKVKKIKDSYTANSEVVWSSDEISSVSTYNREYDFVIPNILFMDGESLAFAWERTDTEGGTRYFYFNDLNITMEKF